MKRAEIEDVEAIYGRGCCCDEGRHGLPQDQTKALELWHRAAELGHAGAYKILVIVIGIREVWKGINRRANITGS